MNKNVQELVEKKEKETYWRTMREYLLIMWDGMGFFGCDDTKLDRLKGEKVEFLEEQVQRVEVEEVSLSHMCAAAAVACCD